MNEKENFREEIRNVIIQLSESFREKEDKINEEFVKRIQKDFDYIDFRDPENFNDTLTLIHGNQSDLLFRTIIANMDGTEKPDRDTLHKLQFVYENYDFIERHLENLIEPYESFVCINDKTRFLINQYRRKLLGKEFRKIEEVRTDSKNYHHPRVGPIDIWLDFIDTLPDVFYAEGNFTNFLYKRMDILYRYEELV